jgi:pSer/pThr/pTyr-binding forkhead associated (FHA) protein
MLDLEASMSEAAKEEAVGETRLPGPDDDAYLSLWTADAQQQRWALPAQGSVVTLGRSTATDVCLTGDPLVSRLHATLEHVGGQWTITDDGLSSNGTYVNGRRLSGRVRLRDRDKIRVGGTVLTFCAPPPTVGVQTVAGGGIPVVRRLTEPQRRVLVALCRPYEDGRAYATPASNQQITEELHLSLDAVKTHLRVLYQRFGIEDLPQNQKRARLAELALQLGLVSEE